MSCRVLAVVGARPQFIKAAMISHEIASRCEITQILVHTGQHFDHDMSGAFFEELEIPAPDVNLGISGGTHAEMTGRMLPALEAVMRETSPDVVLVYGDTNSTLAAALAAAKLCIPIVHAEAGFRTHFLSNPEEVNRICTDHVSSLLFAPVPDAMKELEHEGLADRSIFTGDLMFDAFRHYSECVDIPHVLASLGGGTSTIPGHYYYLTCHRQEHSDETTLTEVIRATALLDAPVVYPVHPRVAPLVRSIVDTGGSSNVILLDPVGYLESIALLKGCKAVLTDSGGLQREAFFAQKKCVTLLPFASANETLSGGRNTLIAPVTAEGILSALAEPQVIDDAYLPFGDGRAATRMVEEILGRFGA